MRHILFSALVFFTACSHQPTRSIASFNSLQETQVVGWSFDWDDNIAYMQTDLVLYRKKSAPSASFMHKGIIVSTEQFTEVRNHLGPGGTYADYEIVNDDSVGSFRNFRDIPGRNIFLEELKEIVEAKGRSQGSKDDWRGPSWNDFVLALSDSSSSEWTSIITARGHGKEALYEAVKYLKEKGLVSYLPNKNNLHAVSHPSYAGVAENPGAAKTVVMETILDRMNSQPLTPSMISVLTPDGGSKMPLHLWGFSDDDYANYKKALDVLVPKVKSGRWPNVKITLYYTGRMHHDPSGKLMPKLATVLKADGSTRAQTPEEAQEATAIHLARARLSPQ